MYREDQSYLCVPLKESTVIGVPQQPPTSLMLEKDSKKCQDCSIVFLTSFRLQRHIKKFHGGVTPTMANSDTPIGDDSNVAEMPRPYSCQLCQKNFTSHAYLVCFIYWQSSPFPRNFQRNIVKGPNNSRNVAMMLIQQIGLSIVNKRVFPKLATGQNLAKSEKSP